MAGKNRTPEQRLTIAQQFHNNAMEHACGQAWAYFVLHADCKTPELPKKAFAEVARLATRDAREAIATARGAITEEREKNAKLRKTLEDVRKKLRKLNRERGGDRRSEQFTGNQS